MIRLAKMDELDDIQRIFDTARAFMRANGNMHQWNDGYPQRELLVDDIEKKQLFVVEEEGALGGVFAFVLGADPTYSYIEGGHWLNDRPYGTIHRIGGDGTVKGLVAKALAFALQYTGQVRADTHEDNKPMQHVLEKNGFVRCGVIYLENGDPRVAYHYSKD